MVGYAALFVTTPGPGLRWYFFADGHTALWLPILPQWAFLRPVLCPFFSVWFLSGTKQAYRWLWVAGLSSTTPSSGFHVWVRRD